MLRRGGGRAPKLLPDLELSAGEIGDSGRAIGARKGLLAVSGFMRGGAGRGARGAWLEPSVGARDRVCGLGSGFCSSESNCKGEGVAGLDGLALVVRRAKGLPLELALLPLLDVLAMELCADAGALPQRCSPMADISIWSPQLEHLMVGRKLAGRAPPALRVAARDIVVVCSRLGVCSRPRPLHRFSPTHPSAPVACSSCLSSDAAFNGSSSFVWSRDAACIQCRNAINAKERQENNKEDQASDPVRIGH